MTREEKQDLAKEALRCLVQLLPPEQYGENSECAIIERALQTLASDGDLADVSGMFVLFKGSAISKQYLDCGEWTTDKDRATQYSWKEANERSSKLGCGFTDA